ncbi:hypothetical protein FKP32DRAFT_1679807 [Trametes sanguinea]|nr:hypothetical protein FKP32DRAFT_1679807 [Trametes sanguinea]
MTSNQNTSLNPSNPRPQKRSKVADHSEEHTRSNAEESRLAQKKEPLRQTEDTPSTPVSPTLSTFQSTPSWEPSLRQPAPLPSRLYPMIAEMHSPLQLYNTADFEGLPTLQYENLHSRLSRQGPPPDRLQKNCLVFTPGAIPLAHIPIYKLFGNTNPDQESGVRTNSASVLAVVIHGGGQRFIARSLKKATEIRSFIQSLRFQSAHAPLSQSATHQRDKGKAPANAPLPSEDQSMRDSGSEEGEILSQLDDNEDTGPSTPPRDEPPAPPEVVVYALEMKHLGDKNCFGQPWTYFVELGPGTTMLREFLLWQGVFAVHPTLSFTLYTISVDVQPWSIMILSGPPGAVEDTVTARRAVLTTIKERLWADRDFLWFTARQVAANWDAAGTLAELVKMATDTLDVTVVSADDPSTRRSAPAYLITGKPVANARMGYKHWLGFFTSTKTYRRGLHCLTVNKLVVDCKLCKDPTVLATARYPRFWAGKIEALESSPRNGARNQYLRRVVQRLPVLFRQDQNLPTVENRLHSLVNDYSDSDESEVIYPNTPPPRPRNPTPSPAEYEFWNPNERVQSRALADDEYEEEVPEQPAQSPTEQEHVQSFEQNIINGHNIARALFEENINDEAINRFALFHLRDAAWHLLQALRHIRGQLPFPAPSDRTLHFPEWVEINLDNALQALSSSHAGHPNFGLYADRVHHLASTRVLIGEWVTQIPPNVHGPAHYYPL